MKTIGIIGGIGPESTVDYYKRIISAFQAHEAGGDNPEIVIYSVNLAELMRLLEARDLKKVADWLVQKVGVLAGAGADFAAIGSNTPHVVFDEVRTRSPIPMVSIVEETCRRAERLGLKQPGLMGTKFTMESDFFQKEFRKRGMSVAVPRAEDREFIHRKLFSEIELGIIKDSTRRELLSVVERMMERDRIDSVILGCTELPLILQRDEYGLPFLNTTAVHAESIVKYCLAEGV